MSGKAITQEQVKLFMKYRNQGDTQQQASAKAVISERSGRRIDSGSLSTKNQPRHWRTRKDPFSEVWEQEIVPCLEDTPALTPITLFEDLQDRHPGRFGNHLKRTFQRRVKAWKALNGPDKTIMFRQSKEAGRLGLSDFTELNGITITIAGEPLSHRFYHFRLPYSGWSYLKIILGGESYTALAEGLQAALLDLGGAPREHRTDRLSAAYKNLSRSEQEDLTERYRSLCEHYGMTPTRNNRGVSHENGAVESPHWHIKRRISQALLLRKSHDFDSLDDYRQWLEKRMRRFRVIVKSGVQALIKQQPDCWLSPRFHL
ncbi:MAG: IS21 family transposase [Candidatus Sedimenticola endophacoides]